MNNLIPALKYGVDRLVQLFFWLLMWLIVIPVGVLGRVWGRANDREYRGTGGSGADYRDSGRTIRRGSNSRPH